MARRKVKPGEAALELIAMFPWWVGVMLAAVAYLALHHVATQPAPRTAQPGQIGALAVVTLVTTVASVGQYLVPVLCLLGAGVSAWRRRESRRLMEAVQGSTDASAIDGMTWQQFEQLVGESFRMDGYRVAVTGGGGPDGGVDLVLNRGGETFLVQCKQWRAFRVGVEVVRELYGAMAAAGAAGGFVVTSGRFTGEAKRFAAGRNVDLIDGARLRQMINRVSAADRQASESGVPLMSKAGGPPTGDPSCPVCAKTMVRRTAKRGDGAGSAFWGCSAYPKCRGTRVLE